jgi:hypothetical protein
MVSLASLAGERLYFAGDSSSGVSGDLESATQIATLMEGYWGMGSTVASHGVTQRVGIGGGGRPGEAGDGEDKKLLQGNLGARIEAKLEELLNRTEALLSTERRSVFAVAHGLETHKTLTGDDIEAILKGQPGPLIDGSAYSSPTFLEMAEAYHAQVMDAHTQHGHVLVPLPKADDWLAPATASAATDPATGPATPTP